MGLVSLGPPADILLKLANLVYANSFVETGTFTGNTTRWASKHFAYVYTIEKSDVLYRKFNEELKQLGGVKPLFGDTRDVLPATISEIGDENAVFWLDAHWSDGVTAGADNECPLLDELAYLLDRNRDIIMIDDARLFLCAPPLPHKPSEWPGIADIAELLSGSGTKRFMQIIDDVVIIIPDEEPLKSTLIEYAQKRSDDFYKSLSEIQRDHSQTSGQ